MRTSVLAALALAATFVPAAPASATPVTGPDGLRCGMVAVDNPDAEPFRQTGVLFAGPLVVTDPATGFSSGTVRCTVRYDALHADGGWGWVEEDGSNVVVMTPKVVSYQIGDHQNLLYLCTDFTYDTGERFYWDAAAGAWTTNPATPCDEVRREPVGTASARSLILPVICPILDAVPVVRTTLRNLLGCDRGPEAPASMVDFFLPTVE